jgi:3-oxoacyl-[acyl-carrier-protein] synthase III
MIVNCECGSFESYANWNVSTIAELEHRFAAFTIGEAATATIVTSENRDDDFYFTFKNFGEHAGLCVIPLGAAPAFMRESVDQRWESGKFFALSRPLVSIAVAKIAEVFDADSLLRSRNYDIVFLHEASERVSRDVMATLALPERLRFATHRDYGNTVSATVPLGMGVALETGCLTRGRKVLIVVGSSGITVGFATFSF